MQRNILVEELFKNALNHSDREEYELTIAACTKILEIDPNHLKAIIMRAYSFCKTGKYTEALLDIGHAINLDPNNPGLYLNLGNIYSESEEYDNAILNFNLAIQLNSEYADAYISRGNAYSDKKQFQEAIENYTTAIMLGKNYQSLYYKRGEAYLHSGKYDLAIEDFIMAINQEPDYPAEYIIINLANAYYHKGNTDLAILNYALALNCNPEFEGDINNLEIALFAIRWQQELNGMANHVLFNIIKTLPQNKQAPLFEKFLNPAGLCLNGTQKNIIEGTLSFYFDTIDELKPKTAIKALYAMLQPDMDEKDIILFKEKEVFDIINTVREILSHPYPQNRSENGVYIEDLYDTDIIAYKDNDAKLAFEFKGLLSLTARDSETTLHVTTNAVVTYINSLIRNAIIKQEKKLEKMQQQNQSFIMSFLMMSNRKDCIFFSLPKDKIVNKILKLNESDYDDTCNDSEVSVTTTTKSLTQH